MNKKYFFFSVFAVFIIGTFAFMSQGANYGRTAIHAIGHKLATFQQVNGESETGTQPKVCVPGQACVAPKGRGSQTGYHQVSENHSQSCAPGQKCAVSNRHMSLTTDEQKVITYIADEVMEGKTRFEKEDIEVATGISIQGMEFKIQPAVFAELNRRNFDLSCLTSANNCAKFSACSVNRDLSGATGAELVRYTEEKSQDGMTFSNWDAPDFTVYNTDNQAVFLSDYRGKPVVLVLMAVHCNHSMDTLPIISRLKKKYESRGIGILPVYVNSTSVEDVQYFHSQLELDYPLLVAEGKDLPNAYKSQMVPSTFLIDRDGKITKKFVGYKDESTLDQALGEMMD